MDKFPLLRAGVPVGELTTEREALYTWFAVQCRLPEEGLWCAWAVGEQGELRLGVLEPHGSGAELRRRFSGQMTGSMGRILRGEVRPAGEERPRAEWEAAEDPGALFRTPWLRQRLRGTAGVLTRRAGERRWLALPYDPEKPFPLEPLFCFARIRRLGEGRFVVYLFDRREWPVNPEEKLKDQEGT